MKIKAVDYASYAVSDLDKSIVFYRDVLGLKLASQGEGWAEFDIGNLALVLSPRTKLSKGDHGNGIALAVDDVLAARDELVKKGVQIDGDVCDTPVCIGLTFKDPDGNTIYLHHRKDGTVG
jgi:catechol 2,3-dioxygenase-like lactoylglutathione lyase family enzyme